MPRRRRGPLSLRFVPGDDDARVAYAIGRSAGGAVQRNRIRRRLRGTVTVFAREGRVPAGAYLIGAGAAAMTMPSAELGRTLEQLITEATGGQS
jgi:ribonuclease P protein component